MYKLKDKASRRNLEKTFMKLIFLCEQKPGDKYKVRIPVGSVSELPNIF